MCTNTLAEVEGRLASMPTAAKTLCASIERLKLEAHTIANRSLGMPDYTLY